jgi:hypothetical protein
MLLYQYHPEDGRSPGRKMEETVLKLLAATDQEVN